MTEADALEGTATPVVISGRSLRRLPEIYAVPFSIDILIVEECVMVDELKYLILCLFANDGVIFPER